MNEVVRASLPRFDNAASGSRAGKGSASGGYGVRGSSGPIGNTDAETTATPDQMGGTAPVVADQTADQVAELRRELEAERDHARALVQDLAAAVKQLEIDAQRQVETAIHEIAATVFPKLSEAFLIEEFGRHLPEVLPRSALDLKFAVASKYSADLTEWLAANDALGARSSVVEVADMVAAKVVVSWGQGGFIFDPAGLIETCLSRLNGTRKLEEQDDV